MKSKINVTQLLRHLIQAAAFLFFPGLFLSIFNALRDVVTALIAGTFSFAGLAGQLLLLCVVFGMTALWGRFFCGYLCSFGAMQELTAWVSKRLRLPTIPSGADRVLKYAKYAVLALIVAAVWVLQLPVDSSFSPWGVFGMLVSGNLSVMRAAIPTVGFAVLAAILIGSFFAERFFCRYLCPLGALFALSSVRRLFRIRRAEAACSGCGLCSRTCAMGIGIHTCESVRSGECIDCMRCVGVCPSAALNSNPQPAVAGTAAALMLCGLVHVGDIAAEKLSDPGRLTATADAEPDEDSLLQSLAAPAEESGHEKKHAGHSGSVSEGVQPQKGAFGKTFRAEHDTQTAESSVPEAEKPETAEKTPAAEPKTADEAPAEAPKAAEEAPAEAPKAPEEALPSESKGAFTDGVYTGSGTGLRGTTQVRVTVENGKIADITVLSYADDRQYFSRAQNGMIAGILKTQDIDVSTVSGATFSSNSILEAVADALGLDFTNPNAAGGMGHGQH